MGVEVSMNHTRNRSLELSWPRTFHAFPRGILPGLDNVCCTSLTDRNLSYGMRHWKVLSLWGLRSVFLLSPRQLQWYQVTEAYSTTPTCQKHPLVAFDHRLSSKVQLPMPLRVYIQTSFGSRTFLYFCAQLLPLILMFSILAWALKHIL